MAENVVKFEPQEVGEKFRFDPDQVLENAKGHGFSLLVILGETEDSFRGMIPPTIR